jgi:hypothetical protein
VRKAYTSSACGQFSYHPAGWKEISAGGRPAHFDARRQADRPIARH